MKMPQTVTILAAMAVTFSVQGVQFNTDAMKELQDKGVKMAEHADELHLLVVGDAAKEADAKLNCLNVQGNSTKEGQGVKVAVCTDDKNQMWRFDDQGRLVTAGDTCIGFKGDPAKPGTQLRTEKCAKGDRQVWELRDSGELVNAAGLCVDASGPVVQMKPCVAKVPKQHWRAVNSSDE